MTLSLIRASQWYLAVKSKTHTPQEREATQIHTGLLCTCYRSDTGMKCFQAHLLHDPFTVNRISILQGKWGSEKELFCPRSHRLRKYYWPQLMRSLSSRSSYAGGRDIPKTSDQDSCRVQGQGWGPGGATLPSVVRTPDDVISKPRTKWWERKTHQTMRRKQRQQMGTSLASHSRNREWLVLPSFLIFC